MAPKVLNGTSGLCSNNKEEEKFYSNKCPKPQTEGASTGLLGLRKRRLWSVVLLEFECPVVALDAEDSSSDLVMIGKSLIQCMMP